ncbi:hypothetical protein [uncultured Sphingomonas sp.]|uniref:hypothetical protein n=1 Tax=uncultured Sphingomonas sp. TaxID=158754 RepID=UPI0025DF6E3C|nr:hypothetical protein [uncultured Sphingomonas sp.]
MADHSVKIAALSLLNHPEPTLNYKSGQFLGGIAFSDQPLSERQERWLSDLLRKHGLPPLAHGGEA